MLAIVSGGVKGLGANFSNYLLSLGYDVIALYNTSEKEAKELELKSDHIKTIKCDITKEEDIINLFNQIDSFDLLINNAAIAIDNEYMNKTKEEFMKVLETNVVGAFLMIKYALDKLSDNGIIINISSNNALDNYSPLSIDYDASKAGVNMLTKDFSLIMDKKKIISICPGWINTEAIQEMNPYYLKNELERSNQKELIDPDLLVKYIINNLDSYSNGDIIEIKEV